MSGYFTTHEAARLLNVSLPTVVNWIKARRLRCHRTPGGHRRIARAELAAFMRMHGMPLPPELADAAPGLRRALVVGDLGPAREGTARQLAQAWWAVEVASPGFPAGAALARFSPDVVVLLAEGRDGGETLRALRADREAGATPVVAVGHATWREELMRAGAAEALARPVSPEALVAAADDAAGPARAPAAREAAAPRRASGRREG
jgi:excisionase family DNA binding protein